MHCFRCDSDAAADAETCDICGGLLDTDPDRYFRAGMDAMLAGEVERSTRLLQDCVKLNPRHLSGRYNLGLILCMADKCDEAMRQYMAVMELEPGYPGIYTALGQAAFGDYLSHLEQAEAKREAMFQLLQKAVEQDPSDVDALYSLANAYMAIGAAQEALPWLQKAVDMQPDSSAIYYALGKAYKILGRDSEAVAMARLAMELSCADDPLLDEIETLVMECEQVGDLLQ
jgi:tetratricopeptide (TPR) repeat protein